MQHYEIRKRGQSRATETVAYVETNAQADMLTSALNDAALRYGYIYRYEFVLNEVVLNDVVMLYTKELAIMGGKVGEGSRG